MFFVIDFSDGRSFWIDCFNDYSQAIEFAENHSYGDDFTISEYPSEADYVSSLGWNV